MRPISDRYVVLGLAPARAAWFGQVGQWSNSGALPCEFVKCLSAVELRARLASGRPFSAALVDASVPGIDRDLVDRAAAAGCVVFVVADGRVVRDWPAIGVAAVLPFNLTREKLLDALTRHGRSIERPDAVPTDPAPVGQPATWRARVAAVCGPGGTGVSTVAITLAQGFATGPGQPPGSVLLADLARCAEQAMLHDARDVVPGVQELVDAHRSGRPSLEQVRALSFDVLERGYHLLLGLRKARYWTALRPRAFEAAFDALSRAYQTVVCDTDADFEGERDGGSVEVEERNVLARTSVARADIVLAVGLPSMKGLHSLARVVHDLDAFDVPIERIVPVMNRAPRSPRARSELAAGLHAVVATDVGAVLASPVFLPDRPVDDALRDGVALPAGLTAPLVGAFAGLAGRAGRRPLVETEPVPVQPGSLGTWTEQEAASQ